MNYAGVVITLLSGVMFVFVRNEPSTDLYTVTQDDEGRPQDSENSGRPLHDSSHNSYQSNGIEGLKIEPPPESKFKNWIKTTVPPKKLL